MHSSDMSEKTTSQFIVYALHHPESKFIYVGKSTTGMKRPRVHLTEKSLQRDARTPKAKWITALRRHEAIPEISVLERCSSTEALNEAERFHIEYYRSIGMSLLNVTSGGDGGCVDASRAYWAKPESREKARKLHVGKVRSAETRAKISAARKGKSWTTQVERERHAARMKLKWSSSEYRQQLEAAHRTPERRLKAANAARLASHDTQRTPEYRAKQSELFKQLCSTEEKKKQRSSHMKSVWDSPEGRKKMLASMKRKNPQ